MTDLDLMMTEYAHQTALKLVYNLAKNSIDRIAYIDAIEVLQAAVQALDAGRDPAENIECINGRICEV